MENLNKIGIIGGVGPQATGDLFRSIIDFSISKYGAKNNNDFPKVAIESVPVPDFISNTSNLNKAKEMLIQATKNLDGVNSTIMGIGSNTVHILLTELQKETEAKFLSVIELVADECERRGYKSVGILGSPMTKKFGLYSKELSKRSIEPIYPNDDDQKVIDRIIRNVLAEQDNSEDRYEYIRIFNNILANGADGIILACTELPRAIDYEALGNRVIDSNKILAEGLVDAYYRG